MPEQISFDFKPTPPTQTAKCNCCGARLEGRWETLSPGLCRTLVKFYEQIKRFDVDALHLQKDCGFTKNEFNNFQKLRYFGLVEKTETAGVWRITADGEVFAENRKAVPKKVFVFRNRVMEKSIERTLVENIVGEKSYWLKLADFRAEQAQI